MLLWALLATAFADDLAGNLGRSPALDWNCTDESCHKRGRYEGMQGQFMASLCADGTIHQMSFVTQWWPDDLDTSAISVPPWPTATERMRHIERRLHSWKLIEQHTGTNERSSI